MVDPVNSGSSTTAAQAEARRQAEAARQAEERRRAEAARQAEAERAQTDQGQGRMDGDEAAMSEDAAMTRPGRGNAEPAAQPSQLGDQGRDVRRLQRWLNAAGAQPPVEVNGFFNAETRDAVERMQEQLGLPATGVADAAFLEAVQPNRGGPHAQLRESLAHPPRQGAFVNAETGAFDPAAYDNAMRRYERLRERVEEMPEGPKRERFERRLERYRDKISAAAEAATPLGQQIEEYQALLAEPIKDMSREEATAHFEALVDKLEAMEGVAPRLMREMYEQFDARFHEGLTNGEHTDADRRMIEGLEEAGFDWRRLPTETLEGMLTSALATSDADAQDEYYGAAEAAQIAVLALYAQRDANPQAIEAFMLEAAPPGSEQRERFIDYLAAAGDGARPETRNLLAMMSEETLMALSVDNGSEARDALLNTAAEERRQRLAREEREAQGVEVWEDRYAQGNVH